MTSLDQKDTVVLIHLHVAYSLLHISVFVWNCCLTPLKLELQIAFDEMEGHH